MKKNDIKCFDCKEGVMLGVEEVIALKENIIDEWQILENLLYIEKKFKNFKQALDFVNRVAEVSELVNHHPDIEFGWGYCNLKLLTHKVNGLTKADFNLASEIDKIST